MRQLHGMKRGAAKLRGGGRTAPLMSRKRWVRAAQTKLSKPTSMHISLYLVHTYEDCRNPILLLPAYTVISHRCRELQVCVGVLSAISVWGGGGGKGGVGESAQDGVQRKCII